MPNNFIVKYVPGRGLCVIGYKASDANIIFSYAPTKGVCPVANGQTKTAKQFIRTAQCSPHMF